MARGEIFRSVRFQREMVPGTARARRKNILFFLSFLEKKEPGANSTTRGKIFRSIRFQREAVPGTARARGGSGHRPGAKKKIFYFFFLFWKRKNREPAREFTQ